MITKKLLLNAVLGAATLFSASSFAHYHSPHIQPQIRVIHHPGHWRHVAIHRWAPHRGHVVVRTRHPQIVVQHYHR